MMRHCRCADFKFDFHSTHTTATCCTYSVNNHQSHTKFRCDYPLGDPASTELLTQVNDFEELSFANSSWRGGTHLPPLTASQTRGVRAYRVGTGDLLLLTPYHVRALTRSSWTPGLASSAGPRAGLRDQLVLGRIGSASTSQGLRAVLVSFLL